MADDDQDNIGFQDPNQEDMPSEMKDHWIAAFLHHSGQGPHPGVYRGPRKRPGADPDEPTETDLQSAREEPIEETSARKMRAAQTGGVSIQGLGPSDIEQAQIKQGQAAQQQTATQGAQMAQQAQAQQAPVNAPPAPTGAEGVSQPYQAQAGPQPQPGPTQGLPPQAPTPEAPPQQGS